MAWRFPYLSWRLRCSISLPSGYREPAGLSRSWRHDSGDPAVWSLANSLGYFSGPIPQGRRKHSLGNDRALRARDASRTDHIYFHAWPSLREWDRVHPKLFWATTRADCRVRGFRSDLSTAESLHSLSIPRPAIRSEDATAGRIFVPRAKRNSGRNHNLCAGYCSVWLARVALGPNHLACWRSGYYLHGRGRNQDRQHHATISDDCDLNRHGDRVRGRSLPVSARAAVRSCFIRGRQD